MLTWLRAKLLHWKRMRQIRRYFASVTIEHLIKAAEDAGFIIGPKGGDTRAGSSDQG